MGGLLLPTFNIDFHHYFIDLGGRSMCKIEWFLAVRQWMWNRCRPYSGSCRKELTAVSSKTLLIKHDWLEKHH